MNVSSTMYSVNWHSENRQPQIFELFTLTCTAKGPPTHTGYSGWPNEVYWFYESRFVKLDRCTNGKPSPVKTCNLTLPWRDIRGKYACLAVNRMGCTFKELELKVTGESRLIQVSNYYYYYYYYYYYHYYYYCYYYYIIIIKGSMLTNFACIALRRWPGNITKKDAKDQS